tara:strand:- start:130 stop:408 length:279 start_codon:yes stop_codon:yes gene_type:complete
MNDYKNTVCLYSGLVWSKAMTLKSQDIFIQAMGFIIDAVALSTEGESRAEIGIYLMSLLVADQKEELKPEKLAAIKQLIEMVDEVRSPAFNL